MLVKKKLKLDRFWKIQFSTPTGRRAKIFFSSNSRAWTFFSCSHVDGFCDWSNDRYCLEKNLIHWMVSDVLCEEKMKGIFFPTQINSNTNSTWIFSSELALVNFFFFISFPMRRIDVTRRSLKSLEVEFVASFWARHCFISRVLPDASIQRVEIVDIFVTGLRDIFTGKKKQGYRNEKWKQKKLEHGLWYLVDRQNGRPRIEEAKKKQNKQNNRQGKYRKINNFCALRK